VLVLAKAPVPGQAKTRLAAAVGTVAAAELAAAALLDTLDAVEVAVPFSRRLVALTGPLPEAAHGREIGQRLRAWQVVQQRGATFADRLVQAHHDAAACWGANEVMIQIGTDTPQLTWRDLHVLAFGVCASNPDSVDAVLGPAEDGGWWALATRRAGYVDGLSAVTMSTAQTAEQTVTALRAAGARVASAHVLRDVDVLADVATVAAAAPATRFACVLRSMHMEQAG
jgi:glycosyltransferase A (GT-A) superfamily protein (DUF2064 family)